MATTRQDVTCPHCKKKLRFRFRDELTSDDIKDIVDKSFFKHTCKECNKDISIQYPVTLKGENYIVYYTPNSDAPIEDKSDIEIKRVCDTFDDFKEKLLILNDGLNDIVVEFVKCYIHDKLIEEDKYVDMMRYAGLRDDEIEFTIIDDGQAVVVKKALYDSLENEIKIKKIDNAVMIDINTFRNYFKI